MIASVFAGCGGDDDPAAMPAGTGPVGGTTASSTGGASPTAGTGGVAGSGVSGGTGGGGTGGGAGSVASGGTGTAGTGVGGTAATAGAGAAIAPSFETLKSVINQAPCFGAGCHNDEQNPLDLRVNEQLYTKVTSRISQNCGNIPVVNPGKPEESAIVKILKGPCGQTPRMPLGCLDGEDALCVPPDYIAAIEQWIAMGAPQQ